MLYLGALATLLSGSLIRIAAALDCHPIFNEISGLGFTTTQATQFLELSLVEDCYSIDGARQLDISKYGIVVLETKSLHRGEPNDFAVITFVDFNNNRWPRKRGQRLNDFFVVGSTKETAVHIDFSFYDHTHNTAKCSRFVNWPNCDKPGKECHDKSIKRFFSITSQTHREEPSYQTIFLLLRFDSREDYSTFVQKFSFVKTSDSGNPTYVATKIQVSRTSQEWLSTRIRSSVVFAPTRDFDKMLPIDRLATLFPDLPVAHFLPPNSLGPCISVSLCDSNWALTAPTPGESNHCSGDNFVHRLEPIVCETPQPSIAEPIPIATTEVPMDLSVCSDLESHGDGMDVEPIETEDFGEGRMSQQVERWCTYAKELKEKVDAQAQKIETMSEEIRLLRQELRKDNSFVEEAIQLASDDLKKKFGLYRSRRESSNLRLRLRQLRIDGRGLSDKQVRTLMETAWLTYYRDQHRPDADFIRCGLCNRDTEKYNPAVDHAKCEADHEGGEGSRKVNLLGMNKVMCIKRFSGGRGDKTGIDKMIHRLKTHASSLAHKRNFDEFKSELIELKTPNRDIEATVSTTLAAYTIAKEGISFQKQLPLLLMSLRAGAAPPTAHYSPDSARNMVKTFAVHMKYDMLKYLIDFDLPFSLLVDGTSYEGVKWIVFLLRTVSPLNRPITFHLTLIQVESEKASDIVEAFTEFLQGLASWAEAPGLKETPYAFTMRKMIALSSDGASVMEGCQSGVHRRLEDLIRQETEDSVNAREDLLLSVCFAHKLNLAVKSQEGDAFTLAQAAITELHRLLGSTMGTRGRTIYSETARNLGFPDLQMDAIHEIRWAASLQSSLSKVLRVYPVLIASLDRLRTDSSASALTKLRAEAAVWVLKDARTFIVLHHVNATLTRLARLSEELQDYEALLVDYLSRWRHFDRLFQLTIKNEVYDYLARSGILILWDAKYRKVSVDPEYLRTYYTPPEESPSSKASLCYDLSAFPDYRKVLLEELSEDPQSKKTREEKLRSRIKKFRDLDDLETLSADDFTQRQHDPSELLTASELGRAYTPLTQTLQADSLIDALYNDVRASFRYYMAPGRRETEAAVYFPYALDKHIILDIIECNGDYEYFSNECVLSDTDPANRGYPEYIDEIGNLDKSRRHDLIMKSIAAIEKYCALPGVQAHIMNFYNTLAGAVRKLDTWPTNFRDEKTSVRFYQTLLNEGDSLEIPDLVLQAIKCILVIPASNADPERSFSTINRLTKGERSNLGTETLDNVMMIHRNGPSVLTIQPKNLAHQWMKPLPGLQLQDHLPSTLERTDSFMKQVKDSIVKDDAAALVKLHALHSMTLQGLTKRRDANDIRQSKEDLEQSKTLIFSSGALSDNDHNIDIS
ncbi:hypothetical protein GCK32_017599 [Trichostrongylus colubriformis]|uniref:HAT C-terminal dimerisation domain-containing protein n=1 Tax=Trichostrongylus colubriformis TaxID=6319 RepID=A0AAN8FC09_TRICO